MARRKNVKRIDPRYFLHETANRNDDGSVLEEVAGVHHYIAQGEGLKDMHGDVLVKRGGSFAVQKGQQPGSIMVGVRHGTGTESWFDRPVDAQELNNHHPDPGYRPPPQQRRPGGPIPQSMLREGDEAELAQAGEEVLADMGEEGVLAQLAQLPPEVQAEVEAAAAATADEASQMNEGYGEYAIEAGPTMAKAMVGGSIAGGAAGGVYASLMNLATANALGTVFAGASAVGSGAIIAAAVYVLAKRLLQEK